MMIRDSYGSTNKKSLSSKEHIQVSCVIAGILFLLHVAVEPQMLITEEYEGLAFCGYQAVPLVAYLVLSVMICLVVLWKGKIENHILSEGLALVSFLVMPLISFFIFEMTAENFLVIIANKKSIIFLNLCIWYLLYAIVFVISNHVKITIILLNTITYFFAVANAFVIRFRDQPILPMDIKSINTVVTVAGEFTYDPTVNMILMGLLMLLCNLWIYKVDFSFSNKKKRILYMVLTAGCSVYCFYGMLVGDFFQRAGVAEMDFFRFKNTYQTDGYMLSTMRNIRFFACGKTSKLFHR